MEELEKTARELILAITEKTLKTLHDKGLLKEPSKLQMLCSSPEMTSLIKKISAPKYDPNRKFRKGDKVRVVNYKGRQGITRLSAGSLVIVAEDEQECDWVHVTAPHENFTMAIDPAYLELVTPVEEQEPYNVYFEGRFVHVKKGGQVIVSFNLNAHPHAKEAANDECDRLNAEYRKEVEK